MNLRELGKMFLEGAAFTIFMASIFIWLIILTPQDEGVMFAENEEVIIAMEIR